MVSVCSTLCVWDIYVLLQSELVSKQVSVANISMQTKLYSYSSSMDMLVCGIFR